MQSIKEIIKNHLQVYPQMQLQDCFKLIYQSAMGIEHLLEDKEGFLEYLNAEKAQVDKEEEDSIQNIGGGMVRFPLGLIGPAVKGDTMWNLCRYTAQMPAAGKEQLLYYLKELQELAEENKLPFTNEEVDSAVADYIQNGCPAVHHSQCFKNNYHPHYRLLDGGAALYFLVIQKIEELLQTQNRVFIVADGMCASGKSTFAECMHLVFGATVLHADDFFLQPHQRTKERLAEPGGNIDYERLSEVVQNIALGGAFAYQAYDCQTQSMQPEQTILPSVLVVLEGAYALHPKIAAKADIYVFFKQDEAKQMERIIGRNGPQMAQRFKSEWIPMENRYFSHFDISQKCNFTIDTSAL